MNLPASAAPPAVEPNVPVQQPAAHVRVRVGDCHIAIAATHVERALAMPAQGLSPLPRRQGALAGLIDLAGRPVPVVSLERWLPMGEASMPAAQQRVLVLHTERARIGLRVDEVMGVKAVEPQDIVRVHHDNGSGEELFESVVPASAGAPILSVLEVDRLMALCQVWGEDAAWAGGAAAVAAHPEATAATTGSAKAPIRHAVFGIGDELWAVPAGSINTVVPTPPVELSLPGGGLTVAISELRGRKLPLVGIAVPPAQAGTALPPWVALLERQGQWIGLLADTCRQLADLVEEDLALTPAEPFLKGIASVPDMGTLRVLDIDKLFGAVPEATMSQVRPGAGGDPNSDDGDGDGNGDNPADSHFLVFEAGALYASPVDSVVGVVELPQPTIDELVLGRPAVMPWRGKTLKVVSLPSFDGQQNPMVPRMAILLEPHPSGHAPVGIAISRLCNWLPAHRADHREMRLGSLGDFRMITHEHEGNSASMVVVDLGEMAYLLG